MKLYHFVVSPLLLLGAAYALSDPKPSWSFLSSTTTTPEDPSESTQDPLPLFDLGSDATSLSSPSLPQQTQTEPSFSAWQTKRPRPLQEKVNSAGFKFPAMNMEDSSEYQEWTDAAGGVAFVVMKQKGQLGVGKPHRAINHTMALFLGCCGFLLCLFIGVYCAYSRGSKKEPFPHHRLYEDGFENPALFLDNPKDYDWFLYETDAYVYPTPSQTQPKPIQTLSVAALKQPPPAIETSLGKVETSGAVQEMKPSAVKLECLSPDNLHTENNSI